MFENQQAIIDNARNELLEVAHQIKAEFLGKIPELIQQSVRRKIERNPGVLMQLADPAISALKTRIASATSDAVRLIDSEIKDHTLSEAEDLMKEFQKVSNGADGLIAPILEEMGFKIQRKEGGLELEEHIIDFSSYYNEDYSAQLRYLMKVYKEKKAHYASSIAHLEKLKGDALKEDALKRWESIKAGK